MSPRKLTESIIRRTPLLDVDDTVAGAVGKVIVSGLPALPVAERGKLAGIFGERELIGALFPAYLNELRYAGFVPGSLDEALEKRDSCRTEPVGQHMNTEHVDVETDYSDVQLAEIFLHHRVLIIPISRRGEVTGVVTRSDFFSALAERFLDGRGPLRNGE
jgi:CBS domain-containing protein